jgi:hypothetical protein
VAFWIACCAFAVPASAEPGTPASAPRFPLQSFTAPFGWSNAVADFNADGRPDVAVANRLGRRGSARYRIDVRLSGDDSQLITFLSTTGDVRIRAIDVDHDHDLDLVATPLVGQHVVGVWLNDGSGHFIESQTASVPQPDLMQRPATVSGGAIVPFAALPPPRRINMPSQASQSLFAEPASFVTILPTAGTSRPVGPSSRPSSPRAPPAHINL